jgi:hypothetical protein
VRKKRSRKATRKRISTSPPTPDERRTKVALREVLNELVEHVRWLSRDLPRLSTDQLDYAQDRLEWLADEVWRLTVDGD